MKRRSIRTAAALLLALCLALSACGSQPSSEASSGAASDSSSEDTSSPSQESSLPSEENPSTPSVESSEASSPGSESSSPSQENSNPGASVSTPFALRQEDISGLYAFNPTNMTYSLMGGSNPHYGEALELLQTIGKLSPTGVPDFTVDAGLLVELVDHTKFSYILRGTGVEVGGKYYVMEDSAYRYLLDLVTESYSQGEAHPQWLLHLNPNRVTDMEIGSAQVKASSGTLSPRDMNWLASDIRIGTVADGSLFTYPDTGNLLSTINYQGGDLWVKLYFDSGVAYTLAYAGDYLYIESSDMSFGCRYTLQSADWYKGFLATLFQSAIDKDTPASKSAEPAQAQPEEARENPMTAKPVIYLYPQTETKVDVSLAYKGRLTFTYPAYQNGWSVTARPDGFLTNLADGSSHYYLFWEGIPNKIQWDQSTGFVVSGKESASFLAEKLSAMGLTAREYNDFITYWGPKMVENPYNLVTFAAEEYEELAPLTISPKPDSILRVHMVLKPLSSPVEVKPQTLPAFSRTGFTVVEWGGTLLD
ncbi:hypothetical protein U6B65_09250 [Oscillospiraceae bacterium MB08-C2-2]|nr:hypothetical protein U6B65_09250 [Oscillospiraceae bacterium MB08-C2-2]